MGNWRTVNITGTCSEADLPKLREACLQKEDYSNFHCLSYNKRGSLCGLGEWPSEKISAVGNLAERDYAPEDVVDALKGLVVAAPSLELVMHCGGDYESTDCVATIVVKDGKVELLPPQQKQVMSIPQGQVEGNFLKAMFGR